MSKKKYVTVAGLPNFHGQHPFDGNKYILIRKDPNNPYDSEAILAETMLWGPVGFVPGHPAARIKGTMSAGRLYDKMGERTIAKVRFSAENFAICSLVSKKKSEKHLRRFDRFRRDMQVLEKLFASDPQSSIVIRIIQGDGQDIPENNDNPWDSRK